MFIYIYIVLMMKFHRFLNKNLPLKSIQVASDVMVRDAHGTTGSCAAAILGSVRIALLRADRGLLFVFKGGIHVPTWETIGDLFFG